MCMIINVCFFTLCLAVVHNQVHIYKLYFLMWVPVTAIVPTLPPQGATSC